MAYDIKDLNLDTLLGVDLDENYDLIYVKAPTFIDEDGNLCLNCETDVVVADYYMEFGGDQISESVCKWAEDHGGYWEWVNPGCLMFCK